MFTLPQEMQLDQARHLTMSTLISVVGGKLLAYLRNFLCEIMMVM